MFETPAFGSYAISRQHFANACCYRTGDMTDEQLAQVLGELPKMTPGPRNEARGHSACAAAGP